MLIGAVTRVCRFGLVALPSMVLVLKGGNPQSTLNLANVWIDTFKFLPVYLILIWSTVGYYSWKEGKEGGMWPLRPLIWSRHELLMKLY